MLRWVLPSRRNNTGERVLKMDSAADSPAPVGDPPTGTGEGTLANRPSSLARTVAPVPSGESPEGPGGAPVLPGKEFSQHARTDTERHRQAVMSKQTAGSTTITRAPASRASALMPAPPLTKLCTICGVTSPGYLLTPSAVTPWSPAIVTTVFRASGGAVNASCRRGLRPDPSTGPTPNGAW